MKKYFIVISFFATTTMAENIKMAPETITPSNASSTLNVEIQKPTTVQITPVLGLSSSAPVGGTSGIGIDYRSGQTPTVGILVDIPVNEKVTIEPGLFYVPMAFNVNVLGTNINFLVKGIELPVVARYHIAPYFSLGAGVYTGVGIDQITVSASGQSQSMSFDDAKFNRIDFGLVGSAQFKYLISSRIGLLLDIRYLFGLSNMSNTKSETFSNRVLQILGGINISL